MQLHEKAIDAGGVGAMKTLATLIKKGEEGVDKDIRGVISSFKGAIRGGSTDATFNLGNICSRINAP